MYDKVLVPIDGSPTALRGFEEAVALARALGSKLVLLHIIDTFPIAVGAVPTPHWEEIVDGQRKHGRALLDKGCRTAGEHGVSAEPLLVEARNERVADTIVQQAAEQGCDVVVMGTHGRRGFGRMMLGSDAEAVVRHCPLPVLLVRHPEARQR